MRNDNFLNNFFFQEKCITKRPPGDEIYRKDNLSVFEVDGKSATVSFVKTFIFVNHESRLRLLINDNNKIRKAKDQSVYQTFLGFQVFVTRCLFCWTLDTVFQMFFFSFVSDILSKSLFVCQVISGSQNFIKWCCSISILHNDCCGRTRLSLDWLLF